jgi:hypothetical protein
VEAVMAGFPRTVERTRDGARAGETPGRVVHHEIGAKTGAFW